VRVVLSMVYSFVVRQMTNMWVKNFYSAPTTCLSRASLVSLMQ
jgi:hypothetical protein